MIKAKHFTQQFGDRSGYVMEGDTITCTVDGFEVTARIVRDDFADSPDETQDGFWPSLDPKDAGYIGPKSGNTLRRHMARAKEVMRAWKNDEWFFCGVVLSVSFRDVELVKHGPSLWGIECNYPRNRKRANAYLRNVANELLDEALDEARDVLDNLLQGVKAA